MAQPGDPAPPSPPPAELRAQVDVVLSSMVDQIQDEWCKICDLDPMQLQDDLLELKNAGPRTSRRGRHTHTALSFTGNGCMAAATCSRGRADFLLTRNPLTERRVRGLRGRQIA